MSATASVELAVPLHDLVVVGASAGGVEALRQVVADLPRDLPACVLVVLHLPRGGVTSLLPEILGRASVLPVRAAADGDELVPGTVLVAPSDRHVVVREGRVALSAGPRENGQRPAVDATLRSAAFDRGSRVIGVVLTGNLDDGSAGLAAVAAHGGIAVVQQPDEALFPGMPRNALAAVPEALTVTVDELPSVLDRLVRTPAGPESVDAPGYERQEDAEIASLLGQGVSADEHGGEPSQFACPDCHGVLWSMKDGRVDRYRCRVGHAWSPESLVDRQGHAVETALWVALRTLEERSAMAQRVADVAESSGRKWSMSHFTARAQEAAHLADVLRRLLLAQGASTTPASPMDMPEAAREVQPGHSSSVTG